MVAFLSAPMTVLLLAISRANPPSVLIVPATITTRGAVSCTAAFSAANVVTVVGEALPPPVVVVTPSAATAAHPISSIGQPDFEPESVPGPASTTRAASALVVLSGAADESLPPDASRILASRSPAASSGAVDESRSIGGSDE